MTDDIVRQQSCPDDELLTAFIEGGLDASRRETVERHTATCASCADVVAAVLQSIDEPPTAAPLVSRPPAAFDHRRRRRCRLALAAGLALVVTAGIGYLGSRVLLAAAARHIALRARDAFAAPVTIGSVAAVPRGPSLVVALNDVRIEGHMPMTAARVEVSVALASLARADLATDLIELARPLLGLEATPHSSESAGETQRLDVEGSSAVFRLLDQGVVEVRDGTIVVPVAGAEPLTITGVNGSARPGPHGVTIAFAGALAGGAVTATGTVALGARDVNVTIGGADLGLATLPYLHDRATGRVDLRLAVRGAAAAPMVSGQLRVYRARLQGWNPIPELLDPPSERGLVAALAPTLGAGDLPVDELRINFVAQRSAGRIDRASFAGAGIHGSGALRLHRDGSLRGGGRASLPPPLAQALLQRTPTLGTAAPGGSLTVPFQVDGSLAAPRVALGETRRP